MLSAFRRVSLRHLAAHKLRTLLTAFGIALGVAAMIGIRLVNDSAARSFERTIDRMAGKAVFQIANGSAGVPEELLDEVKAVGGVKVAAPTVQGFLPVSSLRGERLFVFGIDLLADPEIHEYASGSSETEVEDPLVFLAQPDSVAVTTELLNQHGLAEGDKIEVTAAGASTALTIRATLDIHKGPATVFGGRLAVMDVFAAQRLFGLERRFTQIDVGLDPGADPRAVETALARVVAGRGLVERPRTRGESLEKLIEANRTTFEFAGTLAIIIGLYLILNTMVIAVAQRRREIGILRAIGMRRGEVLGMILFEALTLGGLGCLAGVPLGYGLAQGLAGSYTAAISARFFPVVGAEIRLEPRSVAWSVGLGLIASFLAVLVPAREAVRVQPVAALRIAAPVDRLPRAYRRSALLGAAFFAAAMALWFFPQRFPVSRADAGLGAQLGLLLAFSFVAPTFVRAVALGVERLLGLGAAPLVALASRGLIAYLPRVAITSAALIVSLCGALSLASVISSIERSVVRVLDSAFWGIDLAVGSATGIMAKDWAPLPESVADEIASLPAVNRVGVEEWVQVPYQGLPTHLVARDSFRRGIRRLDLIEGNEAEATTALESGEGAVVSMIFAHRFGKHLGDSLVLRAPGGEARLRIVGVQYDMEDLGIVMIDRAFYRRVWKDDRISFIIPVLNPGADRGQVVDEIRRRWGERYGLFAITIEQLRRENDEVVAQSLGAAYPLIAITLTIALLGVVNSLFASVLDRTRELGVLRAVGALRATVRRLVIMEAGIIGLAGALFGVAGGSLLGYVIVDTLFPNVFGIQALYRYPLTAALFAFASAIVLAAAAGYFPGRSASRLRITEALQYE